VVNGCYILYNPVKIVIRPLIRRGALAVALVLLLPGCSRGHGHKGEPAFVSAAQATLRDRRSEVFSNVGQVKNGERVEILDRDRRFALVRTAQGVEGWIQERYLVSQKVHDAFQKLSQDEQDAPVQASAITRNDTNLHLEPARDADHLYQVGHGTKISILKRATSEKRLPGALAKPEGDNPQAVPTPLEDWWLARDAAGHAGWVLARMVDVDVPLEIAQYAEGQRIVAAFVLDQVNDGDKKVPQYLMLLTEPKDGMPYDYNQARVFTWNVKRHRYETAYRERLDGVLPVTVGQEDFGKEGELPVFVLRVQDAGGNVSERKYKLNTPIVRRVDQSPAGNGPSSAKKP
jgi:SH3-like domain-containing protein